MKKLVISFACATAVLAGCAPEFKGEDVVVSCDTPSSIFGQKYGNVQVSETENAHVVKEANGDTHHYPKDFCRIVRGNSI